MRRGARGGRVPSAGGRYGGGAFSFQGLQIQWTGEEALFRAVAVVEEEGKGHEEEGGDARDACAAVDEFVGFLEEEEGDAGQGVEGAVHDGGDDDRAALEADVLDDDGEGNAHGHHEEDAEDGVLGVVVAEEDEWGVPESPDDADEDGRGDEGLPVELAEEVAAPARLLAEGKESIDGEAGEEARDEGDEEDGPEGEGQRLAHGVEHGGVGGEGRTLNAPGDEERQQDDEGHQQPADDPPPVGFPVDADVAEEGLVRDGLADEGGGEGEEHAAGGDDGASQRFVLGSREDENEACGPDEGVGDGGVELEVFHKL